MKTCGTCGYKNGIHCGKESWCDSYHLWKPKEKQMENKVIFESEEKCKWFLDAFYCSCSERSRGIKNTLDNIKRAGYIRKSAVENIEQILENYFSGGWEQSEYEKNEKLISYFHGILSSIRTNFKELKAENERLKNELQKKS